MESTLHIRVRCPTSVPKRPLLSLNSSALGSFPEGGFLTALDQPFVSKHQCFSPVAQLELHIHVIFLLLLISSSQISSMRGKAIFFFFFVGDGVQYSLLVPQ